MGSPSVKIAAVAMGCRNTVYSMPVGAGAPACSEPRKKIHPSGRAVSVSLVRSGLLQLDVFAEASHQRRLHAGAAQVPGGESRKNKKQRSAQDDGTERDGQRGEAQRAAQTALLRRLPAERGRERSVRAAAHFQSDESGDTEEQEDEKEDEKRSVHREDGRSQHGGESQHGQKQSVAIGGCAVQPHQHHEHKEMHGPEQRGKQRRVRGIRDESAREKENVEGKEAEISDNQPGGSAVR